MQEKIKASDLFIKLTTNSQFAMASEDEQEKASFIKNINSDNTDFNKMLLNISTSQEYMRFSLIKTLILTLIELGLVEEDVNLLDTKQSNELIIKGLDEFKSRQ